MLRDPETGLHDPWLLTRTIAERFAGAAEVVETFLKAGHHRAYNRLWRQELAGVPTASAGSVVLLRAARDIAPDERVRLQREPIGERTLMGCGCFVLVDDTLGELTIRESSSEAAAQPKSAAPAELHRVQRAIYVAEVRAELMKRAADLTDGAVRLPSGSLIQRVRGPLRDGPEWQRTYREWTGASSSYALAPSAADALKRTRLAGGKSLWDWLREVAVESWRPPLNAGDLILEKHRIVDSAAAERILEEIAADIEMRTSFVDAVLGRLAKMAAAEGSTPEAQQ